MLMVEVRINGALLGYLEAVNCGTSLKAVPGQSYVVDGPTTYACHYHDIEAGTAQPFTVRHTRSEGWAVLVSKMLKEVPHAD